MASGFVSSSVSSIVSVTATDTAIRAVLAIALAVVAIAAIDRMKPATPRRPIPLRVDRRPSVLHREPERPEKLRAAANLGAGAVLAGALVACVVGFLVAFALEVVGGLLRS